MAVGRKALVGVVVFAMSTAFLLAQPSREDWQARTAGTLRRLVEGYTGPVGNPCGITWLPPVQERAAFFPAMETALAEALACVRDARQRGEPSWAFWQFQGIDSAVFGGVATTPRGEVHVLHYDNFGGRDDLDWTPCLNPRLSAGPGMGVGCDNRIAPLSAAELTQALVRLDNDVVSTAGEKYRGLPARLAKDAQDEPRADTATLVEHPGFLTRVVDDVQLEIQGASGTNWPVCPRHDEHPLEFRDHRWYCAIDGAFLAELGGLAAIVGKPPQ